MAHGVYFVSVKRIIKTRKTCCTKETAQFCNSKPLLYRDINKAREYYKAKAKIEVNVLYTI